MLKEEVPTVYYTPEEFIKELEKRMQSNKEEIIYIYPQDCTATLSSMSACNIKLSEYLIKTLNKYRNKRII